ncbi:glycosyltransferase [Parasediminibacterium paludis]|uniref:Glycosyltransferase n=1 Tax=Parasediminibacterium paludis TaxID=908966 RepID=A0ABV8PYX8_9BACT
MKLLSVIVSMDPASGGPAQGIRNNVPFWKQQGIVPSILSFDAPNAFFLEKDLGIGIGPVKNPWAYVPNGMHWFLSHLEDYDVVLIHGLWLYNGYAVTKAIKQLKRLGKQTPKVFVMPHGMLDPYFQKAPERRLKALRNVIYWHLIEKEVINSVDGVLFTCEEEMQLAATTFGGYQPKATYNVGYGIIPPPLFSDEQKAAFYDKCPAIINRPYFLFLSRIHPKKGVDMLLTAYASLVDDSTKRGELVPDLVIAGPGMDTEYGEELKNLEAQYPQLADKVHYPGMLQGAAKWGALYGAALFVLPSHQENFGIAIVEAMACNTPVLITKRVNIWQEIAQGKGGIITEDNIPSLIDGFKQWMGMNQEAQQLMGAKAYTTFYSHFTAEATSKKFTEVISR